ncbi:aromatic-ring-hydroxylating dioxygenase subunit beta [Antrihabitans stalactiti]|uniref:Ring-hydroxylating dioxygenase subunit beta n=1 Tax=Antrihabitans stalactiti TaxID=2584121 RepID=A0A848KCJ8_9NOCA|nr:aromatic-ring-hydroxylating dioxygenase subunit beta [Antrihabitans stalactiti]NMN93860.1 ring-hydroxylating dioxygenase subunit beta [Antrihabitans stalactiti]
MTTTEATIADLREIEQFIYREARYADEHDYDSWEALWTDDALYWVPAGGSLADPLHQVSVIYDNRRRISTRLKQLRTGKRYAQSPPSNLRRTISNVEILSSTDTETQVGANFVLYESKPRGIEMWAGRITYVLRSVDGETKLVRKTVVLVNSAEALPTLGFLI